MENRHEPPPEREEVVERHVVSERHTVPESRARDTSWTIWLIPLLLLVIALVWYALTRGQPQAIEMPEVEVPTVEAPAAEPRTERIQIDVSSPTEEVTPPTDEGAPPPEG